MTAPTSHPTLAPFVRPAWREAVGIVLSGDAATQSQLALAWRFLRALHPDVRALCCDPARVADGGEPK